MSKKVTGKTFLISKEDESGMIRFRLTDDNGKHIGFFHVNMTGICVSIFFTDNIKTIEVADDLRTIPAGEIFHNCENKYS